MKSKELRLLKIKQGLNQETLKMLSFKPRNQCLGHLKIQKALCQDSKTCDPIFQKLFMYNKSNKCHSKEKDYKLSNI